MQKRTTRFVLLFICLMAAAASAGPKGELVENSFDFGYVTESAEIAHKFWLKSVGDEQLKITKVIPGCGCTKVPMEKETVEPGDSTWMEIIFSTKKYKGEVSKSPKYITNQSTYQNRLNFKATVFAEQSDNMPVHLEPPFVNLSGYTPETEHAEIMLTNNTNSDLNISIVDADNDFTMIDIPEVILAGQQGTVMIALKDGADEKSFDKSLTFELDDTAKTRYTIPIKYTKAAIQMTSSENLIK